MIERISLQCNKCGYNGELSKDNFSQEELVEVQKKAVFQCPVCEKHQAITVIASHIAEDTKVIYKKIEDLPGGLR